MSGIDLIKRTNPALESGEPIAITTPLFSIAGKKMGKSEGNAVWLSPLRTAPFDFFYYFYTASDDEACEMLRLFTTTHDEELETILNEHAKNYSRRVLQATLASKLCGIVHSPQLSKELCEVAERLSEPILSLPENYHGHISHLFVDLESSFSTLKELLVQCFPEIPRRTNSLFMQF
jgi:tyrosyl-tRNA synthetase